jgi:hypothetical protein
LQGVTRAYDQMSAALGADFTVLQEAPVEDNADHAKNHRLVSHSQKFSNIISAR